eukprot:6187267-Pleurochrysis_carterae.AAC.2
MTIDTSYQLLTLLAVREPCDRVADAFPREQLLFARRQRPRIVRSSCSRRPGGAALLPRSSSPTQQKARAEFGWRKASASDQPELTLPSQGTKIGIRWS